MYGYIHVHTNGLIYCKTTTVQNFDQQTITVIQIYVRNQLSMFCLSVVHMIHRDKFFDYLKQVLLQMRLKVFVIAVLPIEQYFV